MEDQHVSGNEWSSQKEQQKRLGGLSPLANKCLKKTRRKRQKQLTRTERLMKGLLTERDLDALFTVKDINGRGRGVFLRAKILRKDSFVLEYEGDIITKAESAKREKMYAYNNEGCFIMSFTFMGKKLAIDATRRFDSIARLLNHSREPNIRFHPPLMTDLNGGKPRVASYALRDIHRGEELVIDYGIRDGEIRWLRNREIGFTDNVESDTDSSDYISSSDSDNEECRTQNDTTPVKTVCADYVASTSSAISDEMNVDRIKQIKTGGSIAELDKCRNALPSTLFIGRDCGVRFARLNPDVNIKIYSATLEKIIPPQKILKTLGDTTSTIRQSDEESVICLSASSISSSRRSRVTSGSRSKNSSSNPSSKMIDSTLNTDLLPSNKAPDSFHKVLAWQIDSPVVDCNIKIVCVESLNTSQQDRINTVNDHSKSIRQYYKPELNSPQGISINSQAHASHLDQNTFETGKNEPSSSSDSSVLSFPPSKKMTAQEEMAVDISDSDESSNISFICDGKIESQKPALGLKMAGSCKSPVDPDIYVVSDDERVSESPVPDSHLKSMDVIDLVNDGENSCSSECILSEVLNVSNESEKSVNNLPARRPVGFSSPSSQLQVAVIKPFVSAEESTQNKTAVITESEKRHLKSIFLSCITSGKTSPNDIQQLINQNWGFISALVGKGVSLDQIKESFHRQT